MLQTRHCFVYARFEPFTLNSARNGVVLITLSEKRKSVMSVKTKKRETTPTGVTKLSTYVVISVTNTHVNVTTTAG